ncbi:murein biosynthesis integral membrane protein MurJ [Kitasatospora acidiphila]|uniref:murein biosynthesis integral membrane protein MurJ n=1 Tax=Kitasatospora acidiphila TaxID=2567942 RepID=UPI003C75190F
MTAVDQAPEQERHEQSRTPRIRPELAMAAGTALSRLTGLGRVFALSYALGVSPLADAYNLANTTPNMVYDLVLGGVLSATLIPVFVARLQRSRADWEGISAVLTVCLVLLVAAAALVAGGAGVLMRGYTLATAHATAGPERAVAVRLLRLFAPQVLLYGVIALATAVLNSVRRFALAAFAPIANNLVLIGLLLAAAPRLRHSSVTAVLGAPGLLTLLGLGTTAGVAAQALVLVGGVRRAGAPLRWRWRPRHPAVRQVAGLSGWTFAMVAANQAGLFAVLLLAAAEPGGVSAYTYAFAFFQVPFGVVAVSITGARQPGWAATWAARRVDELGAQVADGLRLLTLLMVPIAAVLAALADPIARLLLGHGAAGVGGATLTGQVLALLTLGLPSFSAYLYFIRVLQAMRDLRTAFGLYLVNNGVTVVVALALYRPAGVRGVAVAVAVGYAAAALAAAGLLRRRFGGAPLLPAPVLGRALASGVPAALLAWWRVGALGGATGLAALPALLGGAVVVGAALPLGCGVAGWRWFAGGGVGEWGEDGEEGEGEVGAGDGAD